MTTVDVLFEDLSVQLLGLWVVSGESLLVVGNVDTTVASTLEGTEHSRTGRRALETNVKVGLEGSGSILLVKGLGQCKFTIGLSNTLVLVRKAKLGQSTTGNEETGSVS